MGSLSVRAATPADAATIAAFNLAMARETEDKGLDEATLVRGVERALADPERGRYRVAERDGRVVACLLVTREWSDWRDAWFWWIQSVYVAPDARRTGVYAALHDDVAREARAAGDVCGIRLYVETENHTAQLTYERMGMHRAHYHMFEQLL
ncbi:MAG TPA: GNAT family N-acetyltransferase [Planctomycetota bacterium]|nr:GNAT family N-acetyltransferase [Planctomycetota bacterium]